MSITQSQHLILLVEDEDDLAQIVTYHLQREGFDSVRAATGAEAFEHLQSQSISLVLLDLMLPDMSGVDICRQIRVNENTQNLPVIMVTAKGEEIDRAVGFGGCRRLCCETLFQSRVDFANKGTVETSRACRDGS